MKTRIVLWGENPEEQRILVAIGLRPSENKIDIYTIPEQSATELLYNQMMNQWRLGEDIPLPDTHTHQERLLTVSESILPDEIKVERSDIVQRAQTEWHFVVLSSKLYDSYHNELQEIAERVNQLTRFEENIWEELKEFWNKVQSQIREKNLFREHTQKLKDTTNGLFAKMKDLRRSLDDEYKKESTQRANTFHEALAAIEQRMEEGLGLQPIFEELKHLQRDYRESNMTREDKRKVWGRLDKAFKTIKEKRYGPGIKKEFSALQRTKRRYDGLIAAIDKMQKSIDRDHRDMDFQDKRIEESEGQLESQIRQAKQKMIAERIKSKEEKLGEMLKTQEELERRMEKEKQREESQKQKAQLEEAKKAVKEKIAEDIKHSTEQLETDANKLIAAAKSISGKRKEIPSTDKVTGEEESSAPPDQSEIISSSKEEGPQQQPSAPEAPAPDEKIRQDTHEQDPESAAELETTLTDTPEIPEAEEPVADTAGTDEEAALEQDEEGTVTELDQKEAADAQVPEKVAGASPLHEEEE